MILPDFIREANLVEFLKKLSELVVKDIDLKKTFCINIITKPIPNSTADSTRKKNVSERKFTLSYKKPMDRDNK